MDAETSKYEKVIALVRILDVALHRTEDETVGGDRMRISTNGTNDECLQLECAFNVLLATEDDCGKKHV